MVFDNENSKDGRFKVVNTSLADLEQSLDLRLSIRLGIADTQ